MDKVKYKKGDMLIAIDNHFTISSKCNNWKGVIIRFNSAMNDCEVVTLEGDSQFRMNLFFSDDEIKRHFTVIKVVDRE